MNFKDMCPKCRSENIDMVGDPEFNDSFACRDCGAEFPQFISEEIKDDNEKEGEQDE